ncbi:MAG: excisionase family DNA-binding protein [Peptococcaceae bacterium]|nr:excisionase family DNA-binding protein [Peptococcaceae bacterium]
MYCQECGTKASEFAKFCLECGRKLPQAGQQVQDRPSKVFTMKTALDEYFKGALGVSKFRQLLISGEIQHRRAGTKYLIPEKALDEWMSGQGGSQK